MMQASIASGSAARNVKKASQTSLKLDSSLCRVAALAVPIPAARVREDRIELALLTLPSHLALEFLEFGDHGEVAVFFKGDGLFSPCMSCGH